MNDQSVRNIEAVTTPHFVPWTHIVETQIVTPRITKRSTYSIYFSLGATASWAWYFSGLAEVRAVWSLGGVR